MVDGLLGGVKRTSRNLQKNSLKQQHLPFESTRFLWVEKGMDSFVVWVFGGSFVVEEIQKVWFKEWLIWWFWCVFFKCYLNPIPTGSFIYQPHVPWQPLRWKVNICFAGTLTRKLTWQWKNSRSTMYLVLKMVMFHWHVSFRGSSNIFIK